MRILRTPLNGSTVFTIDGAFSSGQIRSIEKKIAALRYVRRQKSFADDPYPKLVRHLAEEQLVSLTLWPMVTKLLKRLYPGETFRVERGYVNKTSARDVTFPHRDCLEGRRNVTVLYYVNRRWAAEFGGGTVFYDSQNGPGLIVFPAPGRLVFFRSLAFHCAQVPTKIYSGYRYALAVKLSAA